MIKWPRVLQDRRFAEQRARVEAPYRDPDAKDTRPTVADFGEMVKATEAMKEILGQMTQEISAADYLATERFLDALAAEAKQKAEILEKAAAESTEKPADETATE